MALFELEEFVPRRSAMTGAMGIFDRIAAAFAQWRLRRLTVAELSRLDEHQRRDVGFEPADAYDPTNGGTKSLWKKAHLGPDAP